MHRRGALVFGITESTKSMENYGGCCGKHDVPVDVVGKARLERMRTSLLASPARSLRCTPVRPWGRRRAASRPCSHCRSPASSLLRITTTKGLHYHVAHWKMARPMGFWTTVQDSMLEKSNYSMDHNAVVTTPLQSEPDAGQTIYNTTDNCGNTILCAHCISTCIDSGTHPSASLKGPDNKSIWTPEPKRHPY